MNPPLATRLFHAAPWAAVLFALALGLAPAPARACPFCRAVSQTLADRLEIAKVVVVATPVPLKPGDDPTKTRTRSFRVLQVLRGRELVPADNLIPAPLVDTPYEDGAKYLVLGADPPEIFWDVPRLVSDPAVEYVRTLPEVSREPAVRLAHFRDLLDDEDPFIALDAYDEFAKAPYDDLLKIKEQLKHDRLLKRLAEPELPMHLRRLYLVLLGVCGQADDAEFLEQLMDLELARKETGPLGLDATIACYLTLTGEPGLARIEERFLTGEVRSSAAYATVVALRFHGEQEKRIPRERLAAAMRRLLEYPKLADMVMPDLARWEDWSAVDRLVDLFKSADQTTENPHFLRVPIVKYLKACPLPEARQHLAELEKIDPQAVRAASVLPFLVADDNSQGAGNTQEAGDEGEADDAPVRAPDPEAAPAAAPSAPRDRPRPAPRGRQVKQTAVRPLLVGGVTFGAAVLLGGLMLVILGVIRFSPDPAADDAPPAEDP